MKKALSIFLVFVGALFLVSCKEKVGKNGEEVDFSESKAKKSVIRVWIDDEAGDYMEAVIKEFNKLYPNIIVEHQHKGSVDAREHLKTFGPSGNGADVFQFPHDHLAQAVLEDLVFPLPTATATKIKERAHELGTSIATLKYDESTGSFDPSNPNAVERLYAVPMSLESIGLYYNKKLVTGEPVTTYEELIEQAKTWNSTVVQGGTSTNAQLGNYYLGISNHWADSYFMQHIYSAFDWTPFGPSLNNPSSVGFESLSDGMTWLKEQLKPITTGNGTHDSINGATLFEEGKIPYVIGGPWNMEGFKNKKIDFGVAQLPTINGKETKPFAGAVMAAVYKYSKNKEDAIKFVEFLSSDIAMQLQFEYKSKLPALKNELLANIDGVLEDQAMMAMSKQLENAVPMPTIPQVTYYWEPAETLVKEIWNNNKPILDALKEAEASYKTKAGLGA
ncbi:sugar ABC transporter substrate-binding protein [Haploplasma axanthum]|uniref:Cyclodextrin-binding protein n=1 Tax=Haploplasma axanthum TaxID=29552 RepID=A0A449BFA4_HAPAX|nr:extracellular solute-binding protein [Haploplasma axanthum]VEU81129.1 Cyclodextrin-binding protein precursor [Haploplasma axanthum]